MSQCYRSIWNTNNKQMLEDRFPFSRFTVLFSQTSYFSRINGSLPSISLIGNYSIRQLPLICVVCKCENGSATRNFIRSICVKRAARCVSFDASTKLVLLNAHWYWKCAANESSQLSQLQSHDGFVSNGFQSNSNSSDSKCAVNF